MKTGTLATKLMMAAILLTVLVYFGVNLAAYFVDPFSTAITYAYTSENAVSVTGYVVREEEVLSDESDLIYSPRREGEKISTGGTVALVYESAQALNDATTVRTLQARLEQLEFARSLASGSQSTVRLDEEITDSLIRMRSALTRDDLTDTEEPAQVIRAAVLKRSYTHTGSTSLDDAIASLQEQIRQLSDATAPATTRISAPKAGLFSSLVDGYETVLSPGMIRDLTPAAFQKLSPDPFCSGESKIIYGESWSFVTVMDAADVKRLSVGDKVTLRFQKGLDRDLTVKVDFISEEESGQRVVSFTSQQYLGLTTLLRHQNAQIIFESHEGFRIPRSALRIVWEQVTSEDGTPLFKADGTPQTEQVTGVYCVWGTTARFKPVEVIWQEEDHMVVIPAEDAKDSRRLRAGDEVITAAADLYDGKVINR